MVDYTDNFIVARVHDTYDAAATQITLIGGHELADPATVGAYDLVWYNQTDYPSVYNDHNKEIVRVTALSGDVLTVTRGQQGTTATTKDIISNVYLMLLTPTSKTITDLVTQIVDDIAVHAALTDIHHNEVHTLISHDTTVSGAELNNDHSKLNGIETGATADQTKSDIDSLGLSHDSLVDVSSNDHHNEVHTLVSHDTIVTGSELNGMQSKLSLIESGAEANNISDADALDLTDGGESTLHTHPGSGGGDFSNGGDSTGANRTLGNNDNYDLALETNGVNRLTVESGGNINIANTLETDVIAEDTPGADVVVQNAKIGDGSISTHFAEFSHSYRFGNETYTLLSEDNGNTLINASTGRDISFRTANVDVAKIDVNGLQVNDMVELGAGHGVVIETVLLRDGLVDGIDVASHAGNVNAHHAQSHNIVSHSDTTATGTQLNELVDGTQNTLHSHPGGGAGDMLKSVYDTDDSGVVDESELITNQGDLAILDTVNTTQITDGAVNNDKHSNMNAHTLKGNNTVASSRPLDLTRTQVRTLLNVEDGAEVNNISDTNATNLTNGTQNTLHSHPGGGAGDMLKSVYDTDDDGTVDEAETLTDGAGTKTYAQIASEIDGDITTHAGNANAHHNRYHNINFHTDTSATGSELNELTDGSQTTLHTHAGGGAGDMLKSVYDTDDDGVVDEAETLTDGTGTKTYADISDEINGDIVSHASLPNEHHQQVHTVASHSDTTVTGAQLNADHSKLAGIDTGANNYNHPNHTGDVTSSGDGDTSIGYHKVTHAHIAYEAVDNEQMTNMSTYHIKGRYTAAIGDVQDLTATQVRTIINVENGSEANNISDVNATDLTDGGVTTLHSHTGGGGSSLVNLWLPAEGAYLPATNPAELYEAAGSGSYGGYSYLGFSSSTDEHAVWRIPVPDYDGGNMIFKFHWFATATSGNVAWNIESIGVANGQEIVAAVVTNLVYVNADTVDTTTLDLNITTYTTYNPSSVSADDIMVIEISRDISRDNMASDARLMGVSVEYTRS